MREIVAKHLPGTDAKITFLDEYPAMSPTPGTRAFSPHTIRRAIALGYGPVRALDPGARGAGDISFVAPLIDGLDGLGALGTGAHAPEERVNVNALADADRTNRDAARAALAADQCKLRP